MMEPFRGKISKMFVIEGPLGAPAMMKYVVKHNIYVQLFKSCFYQIIKEPLSKLFRETDLL